MEPKGEQRREKTNGGQTPEGRKDREAHLSFCTSAVRHPDDRSTLSLRRRFAPTSLSLSLPLSRSLTFSLSQPEHSRAPRGIALIYVDTIFIRTDR